MGQCDSLITKLITVLLDWYSGDIYAEQGPKLRIKNCSFFKFAVSVKTDNFEGYFSQQKLMFLQIIYQFFPKKILSL